MRHAIDHQLLDKRKSDPERCAAVIPIFGRYQPMVRLDNGARYGQSHAHAFGLASPAMNSLRLMRLPRLVGRI